MRNDAAWDTEDTYDRARETDLLFGGAGDEFVDIEYATAVSVLVDESLCAVVDA